MKQKIYVKRINQDIKLPKILRKGDWIDLCAAETMKFEAPQSDTIKYKNAESKRQGYYKVVFDLQLIPLGVAMLLPDGMEGWLLPRSSTAKGMGLIQANSKGIVDGGTEGYNGPEDEWKFPAIAIRDTTITAGERVCQFRIALSQKATFWQKIKWFLSNGVEIIEVDELPAKGNRGGFGTTGK